MRWMKRSLSRKAFDVVAAMGYAAVSIPALADGASVLRDATDLCKRAADRPTVITSCSIVIESSRDPRLLERAYNRRGMANEQNGRYDLAATDYTNVIRLNPGIAGYFDNRMRAYKGAGRLDLALQDADRAVRMAPTYSFPLHGRGAVYFERGEFDSAIQDFSAALVIDPRDVSLHVDRGRAMMKLDRVNEALLDFESAYRIDPTSEPALRERGLAFAELGRREEARADLAAAVSIVPGDTVAAEALGRLEAADRSAAEQTTEAKNLTATTRGIDDRQASMSSFENGFTPANGAPFCTNRDELQEYVLAARKVDAQWMSQLTSCTFVKGGLKIAIIEAGETVKGTHVDKVRIFDNGESMVGYTLTVDGGRT